MKILVTGANGFIGSVVTETLLNAKHQVVACCRTPNNLPSSSLLSFVPVELHHYRSENDWLPLLQGVDAVINCAGILRGSNADFQAVHVDAPQALAKACVTAGISRFVQISALGDPEDGTFIDSKHRFDRSLLRLMPDALVLRPSVVLSLRGSYGGTSMLRGLAAVPGFLLLPGKGDQQIQPLLAEDLGQLLLEAIQPSCQVRGVVEVAGPEVMSIREYLGLLRGWLKVPTYRTLEMPLGLIGAACQAGQWLGCGPLNNTIWSMLKRGNTLDREGQSRMTDFVTRFNPIRQRLSVEASFVQDRWHAQLFLLQPILWFALCFIWLLSAWSGFSADQAQYATILSQAAFPPIAHAPMVAGTSTLDLLLGVLLLLRIQERTILWLMLLSTLAYTLLLGGLAPELWLDPLGGLLKNLAVLPLLLVYMVLRNPR